MLEISSKEYEIPDILIDIEYIPVELILRSREIPRFILIDGKMWIANLTRAYPFYERYRKEKKNGD